MINPYYKSHNRDFTLLCGDCFQLLREFDFKFSCAPHHLVGASALPLDLGYLSLVGSNNLILLLMVIQQLVVI